MQNGGLSMLLEFKTKNYKSFVEETVFSISGPSSICSQATYTINNLPEGATVQWNVSRNLSI